MSDKKTRNLALNDPVYSGRQINKVWHYVLKHGSNIEKFFDGINIPRQRLFNEHEWFDIYTTSRLQKNYWSCIPDYDATKAYDVSFDEFGSDLYGIISAVFRLSSIQYIVKAFPYFVSTGSKIDLFRILEFDHQSAIIEYTIYPGFEAFVSSVHIYSFSGIFSGIPTLQGLPPAKIEIAASFIDVFKKFRVDFAQFNHWIEEKNGIIYFDGEKAGKWITINNDSKLDPAVHKYLINEKCILWEKDVIETKKNGHTVTIAKKGDLYNCSKTIFRMTWKNKKFLSRLYGFIVFLKQYLPAFLKTREALFQQTNILYEHARILEQRIKEKTEDVYKAQAEIIELEKRSIENRITGGFAHEMRNALTGAQLEIKAATHYRNGRKTATDMIKESTAALLKNILQTFQEYGIPKERITSDFIRELETINETADHLSETISGISTDIERGLSITTQIHEYSKLYEIKPGDTLVDIVKMLKGYQHKYEKEFKEHGIKYSVIGVDHLFFKADESHLNSIFSNLVLNAGDALIDDQTKSPIIHISIEKAEGQILIGIQDNGPGMDKETVREIFEPFFSTKPTTGMGLGLGIVKRTIELYGGQINVESKKGIGSLFNVILPG